MTIGFNIPILLSKSMVLSISNGILVCLFSHQVSMMLVLVKTSTGQVNKCIARAVKATWAVPSTIWAEVRYGYY